MRKASEQWSPQDRCIDSSPYRGTEEGMDEESEKLVGSAATKAVEHALEAFGDVVEEKLGKAMRELGVMIEDLDRKVSAVTDLVQRDDEKVEDHEKRIGRLEDHTGLPALEHVIEG